MKDLVAPPSRQSSRAVPRRSFREPMPRTLGGRVRRLARWIGRTPVGLIVTASLLGIGIGFYHFLLNAEHFELAELTIETDGRLLPEQLRQHLLREVGLEEGVSLFSIKNKKITEELTKLHEVDRVAIHKEWPNRLEIVVTEHQPTAIIVSSVGSFIANDEGHIFARAAAKDLRRLDIPVYTGFDGMTIAIGEKISKETLTDLGHLRATISLALPELYDELAEIYYDTQIGRTLVLVDGGRINIGFRAIEEVGPVIETLMRELGDNHLVAAHLESPEHLSARITPRTETNSVLLAERR